MFHLPGLYLSDGSRAGNSPEQIEVTHMPCEPGCEQSAAPLYKPPEGTYLNMLESRWCMASLQWQFRNEATIKCIHGTDLRVGSLGTSLGNLATADGNIPCPVRAVNLPAVEGRIQRFSWGSPFGKAMCLADSFSPSLQLYAEPWAVWNWNKHGFVGHSQRWTTCTFWHWGCDGTRNLLWLSCAAAWRSSEQGYCQPLAGELCPALLWVPSACELLAAHVVGPLWHWRSLWLCVDPRCRRLVKLHPDCWP